MKSFLSFPPLLLILILTVHASRDSVTVKNSGKEETDSKNILFFLGMTIYSHRLSIWPLVVELANQGHNVTFFSSFPPKESQIDPRIHEISSKTLLKFTQQFISGDMISLRLKGFTETQNIWTKFLPMSLSVVETLAKDDEFLSWMEDSKFDLVFTDSACDFGIALGHKFKAETIIFSTTSPYPWQTDSFGSPVESWIPDMQFAFQEDMSWRERILNVWRPIYWELARKWSFFPKFENILREQMAMKDLPSMEELEKNVSLVLVNTHFSEDYARSLPPKVISIGGLQCFNLVSDNTKLDVNLQNFMDDSEKEGFIYVSFGSSAQMSKLPEHLQEIFYSVMEDASTRFVVKWDEQIPLGVPTNIFLTKWLPQQLVLGHRNIRAFITHGGLLSTQEAVCAGVPLIILPIFGEQDFNANRHNTRGTGIKLLWETLTKDALEGAVTKILSDTSYRENMRQMSKLFLDRPSTPLQTASWWVNYILRHGRVETIQSGGVRQSWYERRLLDVWLILSLTYVLLVFILYKLVWILKKRCGKGWCERGQKENAGAKKNI